MLKYGPQPNQKFAILIKPEHYDLVTAMRAGRRDDDIYTGKYDNQYFTYTISQSSQQSLANRKIETEDEIKLPWNKLNPEDRKIAYVSL
jgi:hypothetical protein